MNAVIIRGSIFLIQSEDRRKAIATLVGAPVERVDATARNGLPIVVLVSESDVEARVSSTSAIASLPVMQVSRPTAERTMMYAAGMLAVALALAAIRGYLALLLVPLVAPILGIWTWNRVREFDSIPVALQALGPPEPPPEEPIREAWTHALAGRPRDGAAVLARAASALPIRSEGWTRLVLEAAALWKEAGKGDESARCLELVPGRKAEEATGRAHAAAGLPLVESKVQDVGPWRSGVEVVCLQSVTVEWPRRCAVCNGPMAEFVEHTFSHRDRIPFGGTGSAMISAISEVSAHARVGYCAQHLRNLRVARTGVWAIPIVFVLVSGLGWSYNSVMTMAIDGVLLFAMGFAWVGRRPLDASQGNDRIVTVRGASKEFVDSLPAAPPELFRD